MTHDNTAAVMPKFQNLVSNRTDSGNPVKNPRQVRWCMLHEVPPHLYVHWDKLNPLRYFEHNRVLQVEVAVAFAVGTFLTCDFIGFYLQVVFTLDHNVQDKSTGNLEKYANIEAFAKSHDIDFYPAGRGMCIWCDNTLLAK